MGGGGGHGALWPIAPYRSPLQVPSDHAPPRLRGRPSWGIRLWDFWAQEEIEAPWDSFHLIPTARGAAFGRTPPEETRHVVAIRCKSLRIYASLNGKPGPGARDRSQGFVPGDLRSQGLGLVQDWSHRPNFWSQDWSRDPVPGPKGSRAWSWTSARAQLSRVTLDVIRSTQEKL